MLRLTPLQTAGDTIVEVMISLAILGLALGISYATATGSLRALRQSQENATASALLQSQAERLRTLSQYGNTGSDTDPHNVFRSSAFCIDDTVSAVASSSASCQVKSRYNLKDSYDAATDNFTLNATWLDVSGDGTNDSLTLVYRLHAAN